MLKIWYKTQKGDKLIDSEIREFDAELNEKNFLVQLREVCDKFNISTPLLLSSQFKHFIAFNVVHFKASDFIDSVDFDRMDVEIVRDKKKRP